MSGMIVVGLQWGDEGKGKIIDLLAFLFSAQRCHNVRSQGGNNAGHTISVGGVDYALHLIPSGFLHKNVMCYITAGCVVDLAMLVEEIKNLVNKGHDLSGRLLVSGLVHLILPLHKKADALYEARKGKNSIGTTGRGIGPCLKDRALRIGIRLIDLLDREKALKMLSLLIAAYEEELGKESIGFDAASLYQDLAFSLEKIRPYLCVDAEEKLRAILSDKKEKVFFEGAQGVMLDGIFGTYPYVTSSLTSAAGICAGAAVPPNSIGAVFGILKAYTTRVGGGPLPTTLSIEEEALFRSKEDLREVGVTTGRVRRLGWLDLFAARYAVKMNGVTHLVITKLDILDRLTEIKLCVGYMLRGKKLSSFPLMAEELEQVVPIYEIFSGWNCSTRKIKKWADLPEKAKVYLKAIASYCETPLSMISVGPDREETICIEEIQG